MKNFKAPLALSLIGFIICSCSPATTSLTSRSSSLTQARHQVSQVHRGSIEEGARPYASRSASPVRASLKGPRFRQVRTTAYSCAEKEKGGIYGRKTAGRTTVATLIVLAIASLVNPLALYWAIVIIFLQRDLERPSLNELTEPDDARAAWALLALFLMVATLIPLTPSLAGRLGIGG